MPSVRRMIALAALASSALANGSLSGAPAPVDPRDPEDPYIWLEDLEGPRVMAWVRTHNAETERRLEADPRYQTFYQDALSIMGAQDRIPYPSFVHGEIYNFWQDERHLRGIWRKTSLTDYRGATPPWHTVLDVDALGKAEGKSWVFKGAQCLPPDQKRCLISLSNGGEDAVEVREFDLDSGAFVAGGFHLPRGKHQIAWEDKDHLLVSTDWTSDQVTSSGYAYVTKRLTRGQSLDQAVEIHRGRIEDVASGPSVLVDGRGHRLEMIDRAVDFFHSESFVITPEGSKRLVMPPKVAVTEMIAGRVIFNLDETWGDLPAGGLAWVPLSELTAHPDALKPRLLWKPGPREALDGVTSTKDRLLISLLDNVNGRILSLAPTAGEGWATRTLALPDKLALGLGSADDKSDRLFASASGFTTPDTLFLVDAAKHTVEPAKSLPARFDAAGLVVDQREATSTDGTRIPYFLVRRQDAKLDGSTPVLLEAYGGFQTSSTPYYSGSMGKIWLERGGAFALANIRGGGEFGPAWHEAALKTKRQVAYDDFAAVAKDMIAAKITSPRRLGILGGSNGGLLMGVAMIQHPELYNAVVIQVPLLDMIRIARIAAGASWQGEYGDVTKNEDERAFWLGISPYHQLRKDGKYPEPFIFTTTRDDRVGPQHARKFAARMEEMGLPFYFYENTEGGHGSGADIKQSAKTSALGWTYLAHKLMD